jgi:hypothetical protein
MKSAGILLAVVALVLFVAPPSDAFVHSRVVIGVGPTCAEGWVTVPPRSE